MRSRPALSFASLRLVAQTAPWALTRALSTLPNNPHIYVHEHRATPESRQEYLLTLLPTAPPTAALALGTTASLPPTPASFRENPEFLALVHTVLATHASDDPGVQAQAQTLASSGGAGLGSGAAFFAPARQRASMQKGQSGRSGAGGASAQGGFGGARRGGYVHVSDDRNPPDYGRVAWPEDIFGSLEVDPRGAFVHPRGRYQPANTYRLVTNEGVFGLSPFLRDKLILKLTELEEQIRRNG